MWKCGQAVREIDVNHAAGMAEHSKERMAHAHNIDDRQLDPSAAENALKRKDGTCTHSPSSIGSECCRKTVNPMNI
jgi:hypothetical protein